jgi:hypothetical protein
MRDDDVAVVEHLAAIGDQVEVEGAGGIGISPGAPEAFLDGMQGSQGLAQAERGFDQSHAIEVAGLGGVRPSGRLPPSGDLGDAQGRAGQYFQCRLKQGFPRRKLAGQVRSKGDDDGPIAMLGR